MAFLVSNSCAPGYLAGEAANWNLTPNVRPARLLGQRIRAGLFPQQIAPHCRPVQPGRAGRPARERGVAAPRPIGRFRHQPRPHRVQLHIAAHLQQIAVAVHQHRLEPPLKQVAHLAVALVEALREHPVDVPHKQRQIRQPRLDHEVVVVAHQAPSQRAGVKPVQPRAQHVQQSPPVHVIHKDRLPPIAA